MNKEVLVIVGSPKGEKGNSNSIADGVINKLDKKGVKSSKFCLKEEMKDKENLIRVINKADIMILTLPIYENSVPGLVVQFFEELYRNKERIGEKKRKLFIIANSGFPEVEASRAAIQSCRLFSKEMNFGWMGGISVSPGTLIDGKKVERAGAIYNKLNKALSKIAETIQNGEEVTQEILQLLAKPLIPPIIYRFLGGIVQKSDVSKIGKDKFYGKPLETV